jgi:lipopolysaccharide/colanic/teichoic acid biosynthesis glycosyltransferase
MLDSKYVNSWSLGLDLEIPLKTIHLVARAHGAY